MTFDKTKLRKGSEHTPDHGLMSYEEVVARLEALRMHTTDYRRWTCPAHLDTRPSLSVDEGENETVLMKCFAGCEFTDVIAALREVEIDFAFLPARANGRKQGRAKARSRVPSDQGARTGKKDTKGNVVPSRRPEFPADEGPPIQVAIKHLARLSDYPNANRDLVSRDRAWDLLIDLMEQHDAPDEIVGTDCIIEDPITHLVCDRDSGAIYYVHKRDVRGSNDLTDMTRSLRGRSCQSHGRAR